MDSNNANIKINRSVKIYITLPAQIVKGLKSNTLLADQIRDKKIDGWIDSLALSDEEVIYLFNYIDSEFLPILIQLNIPFYTVDYLHLEHNITGKLKRETIKNGLEYSFFYIEVKKRLVDVERIIETDVDGEIVTETIIEQVPSIVGELSQEFKDFIFNKYNVTVDTYQEVISQRNIIAENDDSFVIGVCQYIKDQDGNESYKIKADYEEVYMWLNEFKLSMNDYSNVVSRKAFKSELLNKYT